ncbi:MAG: glycosyltransferase family 2 protein, partial [Lachnospiraceae bacterium]|nr:glycosyltransferase family 2 protein [Lachnospiraceae bacterium]
MDMNDLKLTVIIPCYNEKDTLEKCLDAVRDCGVENLEIIVIDDCSTDGTRELIKEKLMSKIDKVFFHKRNCGKGRALRSGFRAATGDLVIVQDADLEYDPKDYQRLMMAFV